MMNPSSATKTLPRHFSNCKQAIQVSHCRMLKSMISKTYGGSYSSRFASSTLPQVLQKRNRHSNICMHEPRVGQSCNLHQFEIRKCPNPCHQNDQRRNFCVLQPSRPIISSGYFSENRDSIVARLGKLNEKSELQKSWKVSGKVKINDSSKSAVILPFCLVGGEPSILLTLRSTKLNSHRGQVSFPGGRIDNGDANEIQAALREMEEELGIPSSCADIWGQLPPIIDRTQRLVFPIVGFIGDIESLNMQMNPHEVEAVFTMTLAHLCDARNRSYTFFARPQYSFTSPVYLGGDHRVWGLSAILLNTVLGTILPDEYVPLKESVILQTLK